MRTLSLFIICTLTFFSCNSKKNEPVAGQEDTSTIQKDSAGLIAPGRNSNIYAQVDVSPMDMSYYPEDYPKMKMAKTVTTPLMARVIYSRPHLGGRQLFHDVLKYGEPWRLGANEATELGLYKDVTIQGKKLNAGRYIIYCIPEKDKWIIVINTNIDSWGLEPDPAKDIEKFSVPVKVTTNSLEYFTMVFREVNGSAGLLMAWDNVEAFLPISF